MWGIHVPGMEGMNDILIVEDSKTQALKLRRTLESRGYSVRHAPDGRVALGVMRDSLPALVISDVMMPEMDGFEFCEAVKTEPALAKVPVILVTTLSDPTDVIQALQSGADNFLTKPYKDEILFDRIDYTLKNLEIRNKRSPGDTFVDVLFDGKLYSLNSSRIQMVDLLLSTYESAIQKNQELFDANRKIGDALSSIKILQSNYLKLLETNRDAILVIDEEGLVRFANAAAKTMFGDSDDKLKELARHIPRTPGAAQELELQCCEGLSIHVDARIESTDWDGKPMALAVLRDITDSVRMRKELQQLSLTDELTGLYNRRGFALLAERAASRAGKNGERLFVMFSDLDFMKHINDTWGHKEGDRALMDTASILRRSFRDEDILARMGGDEFAAFGILPAPVEVETLIKRVQDQVTTFNSLKSREYPLALSVGACIFDPATGETFTMVLERADTMMYEIKKARHALRAE